jgi:hypothetical protein
MHAVTIRTTAKREKELVLESDEVRESVVLSVVKGSPNIRNGDRGNVAVTFPCRARDGPGRRHTNGRD